MTGFKDQTESGEPVLLSYLMLLPPRRLARDASVVNEASMLISLRRHARQIVAVFPQTRVAALSSYHLHRHTFVHAAPPLSHRRALRQLLSLLFENEVMEVRDHTAVEPRATERGNETRNCWVDVQYRTVHLYHQGGPKHTLQITVGLYVR
ncbi:hypothetical protein BC834DRAFT_372898 [Gloeopeniophorella convolvens]|nr:hypothetical protein BC834DRAFT_372898 [Gloeopeniophorella convolvens]